MPITLTCARCRKTYEVPPSQARPGRLYCSNACRRDRVVCTCHECKTTFEAKPSTVKRGGGLFCSQACQRRHSTVNRQCKQCGVTFETQKSQLKWRSVEFCSNACRFEARKIDPRDRFWTHVQRAGADDCWPWTGFLNADGYGHLRVGTSMIRAHRYALMLSGVDVKAGDSVLHSCDHPACCNPGHLRVGTQQENIQDMLDRNRYLPSRPHGESHSSAKLTAAQVVELRARWSAGEPAPALARSTGLSKSAIYSAVTGKTWKHLNETRRSI